MAIKISLKTSGGIIRAPVKKIKVHPKTDIDLIPIEPNIKHKTAPARGVRRFIGIKPKPKETEPKAKHRIKPKASEPKP